VSPIVKKILRSAARIAVVLAGLFVIYCLVCLVFYYLQFVKMPAEPTSALDARVAEFRAAGRVNNSMDDYAALQALVKDIAAAPPPDLKKLVKSGCPPYDVAELKRNEAEFRLFEPFAERLRPILARGLMIGLDFQTPEVNVSSLRDSLTYSEMAAAVLDAEAGHTDTAASRLVLLLQLAGGLQDSTQLLHDMVGISVEENAYITIAFLTPKLSETEIDQLRREFEKLPDTRGMLLRTLKMQLVRQIDCVDNIRQNPAASAEDRHKTGGVDCSDRMQDWWLPLTHNRRYFDRERYMMISISAGFIDGLQKWLDGGCRDRAPGIDEKKLRRSVTALVAIPNFAGLADRCNEAMKSRAAILRALELELARRKTGDTSDIVLPYSEGEDIVIGREYGCIRAKAEAVKR